MMFRCFRFLLIVLSLMVIVLEGFAFTSAYQKKPYLTNAYLVNFHMTQVNLSELFDIQNFKRELYERDDGLYKGNCYYGNSGSYGADNGSQNPCSSTGNAGGLDSNPVAATTATSATSAAAAIATTAATAANSGTTAVTTGTTSQSYSSGSSSSSPGTATSSTGSSSSKTTTILTSTSGLSSDALAVYDIATTKKYSDIGLADVYALTGWGYCKGRYGNQDLIGEKFDNNNITYYWCSKGKSLYHFDPVKIIQTDLNATISNTTDATLKSQLTILLNNLSNDTLRLPGNLESKIKSLNSLQDAVFIMLIIVLVLTAISIVIQLLGCIISPESCCLSFLNYMFQCAIFLLSIVVAGIATGKNLFIRTQVNDNTDQFGIKSYISAAYYAYIWSAVAAGWIICVIALLGHCCGLFATHRHRFRKTVHSGHHHEESGSEKGHSSDSE